MKPRLTPSQSRTSASQPVFPLTGLYLTHDLSTTLSLLDLYPTYSEPRHSTSTFVDRLCHSTDFHKHLPNHTQILLPPCKVPLLHLFGLLLHLHNSPIIGVDSQPSIQNDIKPIRFHTLLTIRPSQRHVRITFLHSCNALHQTSPRRPFVPFSPY